MFTYPTFRQLFRHSATFGSDRIKFAWRCYRAAAQIKDFEQFVNADPFRQQFFTTYASSDCYPVVHSYLDKRLSHPLTRLSAIQYDVEQAQQRFPKNILHSFLGTDYYTLAKLTEELRICLNHNDLCSQEGLWAISLRNQTNERLYTATFAFLPDDKMLITSIQGPSGSEAKNTVRQLTKILHGLRPQALMLIMLQFLAQHWQQNALLGIAQEHHIKTRFRFRKRYLLDYDEFWINAQAQKQADGYWHLPLTSERKNEADIDSKKRSMYRKRYAMLDDAFAQMAKHLGTTHDDTPIDQQKNIQAA